MANNLDENQTESKLIERYETEDIFKNEEENLPKRSVFEEPNYEDKSPTTFDESLKKRWGEIKPKLRTMIVERVDRPK